MSLLRGVGRGRAFFRFLFAVGWLAASYFLAEKAAHGFTHGAVFPLLRNIFEIFLLVLGYSYMELSWEDVRDPLRAMGLGARRGAAAEFALGAALGWGMVTAVFLVIVLGGKFYMQLWGSSQAWAQLVLQVLVLAAGSLAAEIAFRGYPFQKLIQATGPFAATVLAGIFFGLLRRETPEATPAAMWISAVAAVLLSVAYLRTHALWICWGLHFSWLASIGILFGQPLAHNRQASSVLRSYVDGPTWLTGGEYGPEASLITLLVLWIGLYVLVRVTRELAWKARQPELHPAAIPMEFPPPIPAPRVSVQEAPKAGLVPTIFPAPSSVSSSEVLPERASPPALESTPLPSAAEPLDDLRKR